MSSDEDDVLVESEDFSDYSESENRKPAKQAKQTKAKQPRKSTPENDNGESEGQGRSESARKALAAKFEKLSQREHILKRPDTYVGSIEPVTQPMWVLDSTGKRMVERNITFVPALYKIFDEILVNAADNKRRDGDGYVMKEIRVEIKPETGRITVKNDGKSVPVEKHDKHNLYIPEMIFGHLLTGENFNDEEERTAGGRNGYGAKLTNIYSTSFRIETNDVRSAQCYSQEWTNNMEVCGKAKITKAKAKDYTEVSFIPDYARFRMQGLDEDTLALFKKRVYDIAGVTDKSIKVYLNGELITCNTFEKYMRLYTEEPAPAPVPAEDGDLDTSKVAESPATVAKKKPNVVYSELNERWQIAVTVSKDAVPTQVSFVNSICTYKGGSHVQLIQDKIVKYVLEYIEKKHKAQASVVKPQQIKNHLWLFVNSLIVNPSFDSQTKENLTTKPSLFAGKDKSFLPEIRDEVLAKIVKQTGIVDSVLFWATQKQMKDLKRVGGKKKTTLLDIPKLDDANNAGGRRSQECTLILTEGDSAKTLALSGISVVGRDNYGVFPLKGKLLNVREAAHSQIMKNTEIQNLMRILGLQPNTKYESTKDLRYGHVMVMTDQDQDGSHIKGLVFNFFHHYFPSLLEIPGFLQVFVTPIVKVSKKDRTLAFYSLREYEEWKMKVGHEAREKTLKKDSRATEEQLRAAELASLKSWRIKYYKGLGTNSSKEAQEYFARIDSHSIEMCFDGQSGDALDMAFSKARVEDRKSWLLKHDPENFKPVDFRAKTLDYRHFVDGELVLFSLADNVRSIPSAIDGFKPSQRKVLYGCLKRNLVQEIKVSQLSGYVSEHAAYHHGEESLSGTIINMAQSFVGSNNVPLLHAGGAFGTRRLGGKDSASPRYIFTRLLKLTRLIFHPNDDALLKRVEDDGMLVEPKFYAPIVPMLLINGSSGIGTGWSTEVPSFNPRTVVQCIRLKLQGKIDEAPKLVPYFKDFTGDIVEDIKPKRGPTGRYFVRGKFELVDDKLYITELPVGKWTATYKEFLVEAISTAEAPTTGAKGSKGADKNAPAFGKRAFPEGAIKEIRENHTDETVSFELTLSPEFADQLRAMGAEGILTQFQLQTTVSTSNMHAFDEHGMIRKYETPEQLLDGFFRVRLPLYEERKRHLEREMARECEKLSAQARFVKMMVEGQLVLSRKSRAQVVAELQKHNFPRWFKVRETDGDASAAQADEGNDQQGDEQGDSEEDRSARGYDYLLSLTFWSLTLEKFKLLESKAKEKAAELEALRKKRPEDLWIDDLDALEKALDEMNEEESELRREQEAARGRARGKGGKPAKRKPKKAHRGSDDEMDLVSSSEDDFDKDFDSDDEDFGKKKKKPAKKAPAKGAKKGAVAEPTRERTSDKPIITSEMVPKQPVYVEPLPNENEPVVSGEGNDESNNSQEASATAPTKAKAPRAKAAPKAPKEAKPARKTPAKKKAKSSDSEDETSMSESDVSIVVPKDRPKRAAVAKKPKLVLDDDDSDIEIIESPQPKAKKLKSIIAEKGEDEDEFTFTPEAAPKPKKTGKPLDLKKSPAKAEDVKPPVEAKKRSLRDELAAELEEEEEKVQVVEEKVAKPSRAATRARPKYIVDDEDSLLDDDDDSFSEDDDDDEFEDDE